MGFYTRRQTMEDPDEIQRYEDFRTIGNVFE